MESFPLRKTCFGRQNGQNLLSVSSTFMDKYTALLNSFWKFSTVLAITSLSNRVLVMLPAGNRRGGTGTPFLLE
jgi:hypothetical protein